MASFSKWRTEGKRLPCSQAETTEIDTPKSAAIRLSGILLSRRQRRSRPESKDTRDTWLTASDTLCPLTMLGLYQFLRFGSTKLIHTRAANLGPAGAIWPTTPAAIWLEEQVPTLSRLGLTSHVFWMQCRRVIQVVIKTMKS